MIWRNVTVGNGAGREGDVLESSGPSGIAVALVGDKRRRRHLGAVALAAVGRVADRAASPCRPAAAVQKKKNNADQRVRPQHACIYKAN